MIYIYSTPSIPTTETTHGLYEESVIEKEVIAPQESEAQSGEASGKAQSEKAREEDPDDAPQKTLRD